MRIFLFNRYFWPDLSAASQVPTDFAVELAARGHEVVVVSGRLRLDIAGELLPLQDMHRSVRIHRLKTGTSVVRWRIGRLLDSLAFHVAAAWFVLRQVRRNDVMIALSDPPLLGALLDPIAGLKRADLIHWVQDVYPEVACRLGTLREHGWRHRMLRALRNRMLRRARFNVVLGERMKDYLSTAVPDAAPLHIIHNASPDLAWYGPPTVDNPYRRKLGLKQQTVFCYSGNLGRAHRFEALLAAGQMLRNRRDIHFLIIGDGVQLEEVRNGADRRGLLNWTFLPYQSREKLSESLGAADVHLVSLDPMLEGLIVPSKIYGVLAAGRPCIHIGDRDGEIARLLARHDCGLTVPPESPGKLQETLLRLSGDPELRQRMGVNARAASERDYALANAVDRWERLLAPAVTETAAVTPN